MRTKRAVALGVGILVAGGAVAPAFAYRYDPVQKRWVIECSDVPAWDRQWTRTGWQPFAAQDYNGKKYFGARTDSPYFVAYVDPAAQKVTVAAFMNWEDTAQYTEYYQGPWYFDSSVSISPQAIEYCNENVNFPAVRQERLPVSPPAPPATIPSRTAIPPPTPFHTKPMR